VKLICVDILTSNTSYVSLRSYNVIVIYIRVRDVNFPARQLVSDTMAQPSALLVGGPENTSRTTFVLDFSADQNIKSFKNQD
jgi:hypothetical protein